MPIKSGLMMFKPMDAHQGNPLDLDAFLGLVKGWGLETIDVFPGFLGALPAADLRRAMDEHGLACACYYIAADLNAEGAEAEQAALDLFKQGMDNAATLGAPICFTHGTQHSYAGEDMFQRYTDRLGEMLGLFEDTDMMLIVENAGTLMHKVDDMLRLMDALGEAGLRLCLDTGNFHLWGQDEVDATRRALPWTVHFHVKDYVDQHWVEPGAKPAATQVDLGTGDVRNLEALAVLQEANWEGVLAFEPHGDDSIEPGLKTLTRWLRP